ncbi:MAG: N-acetylmuramic acid 6-phosphate etherase [Planctomycetota bacterium]
MSVVPDRGHLLTEQRNPRTAELHRLGVRELVRTFREEDRAVLDAMASAEDAIASLIEAAEPGFCRGGRLIYLGAGTSGRLGVLDASEAPPTFQVETGRVVGLIAGGDAALKKSSEHREDEPLGAVADLESLGTTSDDTVIGIAAGGTTPYVLGGLEWCSGRADRPTTAMICCTPIATPRGVDHLIVLPTGAEVLTGSTRMKAGTATKLTLNTISTSLMIRSGRVYGNLMVDLRATNAKLRDRAARIVSELTGLGRDESFALLDAADGEVKTAAVMHVKRVDATAARAALDQTDGRLDRVLGA